jgi:penicillin-insensitive murein DD-endopeptidase
MWWVTDYLNPPKKVERQPATPRRRHPREFTMADLPQQCAGVLASN